LLDRHYPASLLVRALRHPKRPSLPLTRCQLTATTITARASRVAAISLCLYAVATTPAGLMEPIRLNCFASVGLPLLAVGRLLHCTFRGLLSVYSRYGLHARQVAYATLYTRGSDDFVSSVAALIATGWSEPAPGRDFHPLRTSALSRRTASLC
jgi:hypothetical protein